MLMKKENKYPKNRLVAFLILIATFSSLGCSTKDPDIEKGAAIYAEACKVCHAQGVTGAPVLGNLANWKGRPRPDSMDDEDSKDDKMKWSYPTSDEVDLLVEHATNGFGLMPAKGGKPELTEQEIRYAVKYMLSALEESASKKN